MRSLPLLFLFLLVACGGGDPAPSGANQDEPPVVKPPVDPASYAVLPAGRRDNRTFAGGLDDGTTIIAGAFYEDATFAMADGTNRTLTSAKYTDAYLARLDRQGRAEWVLPFHSSGVCIVQAFAMLPDDSVILALSFASPVRLPSTDAGDESVSGRGTILARYSADGARLWFRQAIEGTTAEVNALAAWPDGSTALCGRLLLEPVFGPGTPQETTFDGPPTYETRHEYLARFDPQGALVSVESITGGAAQTHSTACVAMPDRSVVVSGDARSDVTIGADTLPLDDDAAYQTYVARVPEGGAPSWARATNAFVSHLALDADGAILAAGSMRSVATFATAAGTTEFTPGLNAQHGYLARLDGNGYLASIRAVGTTSYLAYARAVPLPDGGHLFAGVGRGELRLASGGSIPGRDASALFHFAVLYDAAGEEVWARIDGHCFHLFLTGLVAHPDDSFTLSGIYRPSYAMDLGLPTEAASPEPETDDYRAFVTRIRGDGTFGSR